MAEHFSFFDAVQLEDGTYEEEYEYDAQRFTNYFKTLVTTGVMKGAGNMLAVSASGSNMVTKVNTGIAFIEGRYYENDSLKDLTHDTETLGVSRIDRIVVRMDLSTEARYVRAFIKKGVPSTNPVAPVLTQTPNLYEISLAQVKIVGGQTFIATNAVTDERGKDDICPWAGSNILPNFDNESLAKFIDQFGGIDISTRGITSYNQLTENGIYFNTSSAVTDKPRASILVLNGKPIGDIITVAKGENGVLVQTVYCIGNSTAKRFLRKPIVYFRGYYDGVWGNYYQPIDNNDIQTGYRSIYVNSTTGNNDTADGTSDKPYKSLQFALQTIPNIINSRVDVYVQAGSYSGETVQIFNKYGGVLNIIVQGGYASVGYIDIDGVDNLYMKNITSVSQTGMKINNCRFFDIDGYTNTIQTSSGNTFGIEISKSTGILSNCLLSNKSGAGVTAYDVKNNSNVLMKYCQGGSNTIGIFSDGSIVRRGLGTSVSATTPTGTANAGQII